MKGILFDLDGVLVDVSESYNLTIKMVVERLAGRLVSDEDIEAYRSRGGLNNDWDLTECIIREVGGPADRTAMVALFQKIYRGKNFGGLIRKETPLVNVDVLRKLRKTHSLGIVTGRPRDEAALHVGQVLEDIDKKLDGGEDLCVGAEIVGVACAISHGVCAPLLDEKTLEGDRRTNLHWARASRVCAESAGMRTKPTL